MLQRQVDVLAYLRLLRNRRDEFIGEILRIAVEHTQPLDLLDFHKLLQETRQGRLAVDVLAVIRRILSDEYDLPGALGGKACDLALDVIHRSAAKASANQRNGTESAAMVAALGNLHISRIDRRRQNTRRLRIVDNLILSCQDDAVARQSLTHRLHDTVPCTRADDGVGLGHVVQKLLMIAFPETACDDERATAARFLVLRHIEHRRDGFLLRRLDESACIDDDDLRFCRIGRKFDAVVLQDAEHDFRIDEILGAAEADESCFQKISPSRYIKHKGRNP